MSNAIAVNAKTKSTTSRHHAAPTRKSTTVSIALLNLWIERSRGRRELRNADARLLDDIGISRADAIIESKKPFWIA